MATQSKKQWGGRFVKGTDPRTELFTESISFDKRLYAEDIVASIAHAQSLVAARVLTAGEAKKITVGLQAVAKKIAAGKVKFEIGLEDIHTHIENELKKINTQQKVDKQYLISSILNSSVFATESEILAEEDVIYQDLSLAIIPPVCGG